MAICQILKISKFAKRKKFFLLNSAESLGTKYKDKFSGMGYIGTFSLQQNI